MDSLRQVDVMWAGSCSTTDMLSASSQLDARIAALLREAHEKMLGSLGRDRYALFSYFHGAMARLAPVDTFYVGLIENGGRVFYPYTFDGAQGDDPGFHLIGPDGPTAWLLRHKRTYTFDQDGGAVLMRGLRFGDVSCVSADVVTVPFLRAVNSRVAVFGMASMHSYTAAVYTPHMVAAFEWLSNLVARLVMREREDIESLRSIGLDLDEGSRCGLALDHLVGRVNDRLGIIRRKIEATRRENGSAGTLTEALDEVHADCERLQSEMVSLLMRENAGPADRFGSLTPAERVVAQLIAQDLTNGEIAERLHLSRSTVKTHVARIIHKYGSRGRQEVAADVLRYLHNPTVDQD